MGAGPALRAMNLALAAIVMANAGLRSGANGMNVPASVVRLHLGGYYEYGVGGADYVVASNQIAAPYRWRSQDGRYWEPEDQELYPEMFGGGRGNPSDDNLAQAILIQAAQDLGREMVLRARRTYSWTPFTLDPSKASLRGRAGAILDFSAATTGTDAAPVDLITISASTVISSFQVEHAISNLSIVAVQGQNVFRHGNGTARQGIAISLWNLNIRGGTSHHIFDSNCYYFYAGRCRHSGWYGASISYTANVVNSGENMLFDVGWWNDPASQNASLYNLTAGEIRFRDCSVDYLPSIGIASGALAPIVQFDGGHIEYSFPHNVASNTGTIALVQQGPMLRHYSGSLRFRGTKVMRGSGCPYPLVRAYANTYATGYIDLSLTEHLLNSYDYVNNANYVLDKEDNCATAVTWSGMEMLYSPPVGGVGAVIYPMKESLPAYPGATGGIFSPVYGDYTFVANAGGQYLEGGNVVGATLLRDKSGGVGTMTSAAIPVRKTDRLVGKVRFRVNELASLNNGTDGNDSYVLIQAVLLNSKGAVITSTIPEGNTQLFGGTTTGVWITKTLFFGGLSARQLADVSFVQFKALVYNKTTSGNVSVDIVFPQAQFL